MSYNSICAEVRGAYEEVGKIEPSAVKVKVAGRTHGSNDKDKQAAAEHADRASGGKERSSASCHWVHFYEV